MEKTQKAFIVLTPHEPPFDEVDHGLAFNEGRAIAIYPTEESARKHYNSFPIVPCVITYQTP